MFYLPILYYPTKRDGPRDRLPDPDLRLVVAARPVASQRVLLGDQPQPGRDDHPRLVLEDRPGRRQRVPLQLRHRRRQHPRLPRRPARGDLRARRTATTDCPAHAATRSAAAPTRCCPAACARAANVNYFSSIATLADVQHQHLRRVAQQPLVRRQRRRRLGQVLDERHARSQRVLLQHDRLGPVGQLAARHVHAQRAADPRLAGSTSRSAREYAHILRDHERDGDRRPIDTSLSRVRRRAADPLSVQEVAVVHRELDASAGATPTTRAATRRPAIRSPPTKVVDDGAEPAGLHPPGADRRAGVQPDLGHAGQRLRREVQALDRAVPDRAAAPRRSTTSIASSSSTASISTSAARRSPTA